MEKTLWQRLADAAELPVPYRDEAQRELKRLQSMGAVATDSFATEHRAKLPVLPEPALVLHVAPNGNDAAAGTEAAPLATLAGARDALRKWRASAGGSLPNGGAVWSFMAVSMPSRIRSGCSKRTRAPRPHRSFTKRRPVRSRCSAVVSG